MAAEAPVAEQAPAFTPAKPTLITTPVSNCAARVRFLVYKKGLEEEIAFLRPVDPPFEGLKSAAYLALNPQGKMPMLVLPDGTALPESQVIETYLVDKYAATGPSLLPPTPEARARAALAARILDLYITPVQVRTWRCSSMRSALRSAGQRAVPLRGARHLAVRAETPSDEERNGTVDWDAEWSTFKQQRAPRAPPPPRAAPRGWNDGMAGDAIRRTEAGLLNAWAGQLPIFPAAVMLGLLVLALANGPPSDARCTLPCTSVRRGGRGEHSRSSPASTMQDEDLFNNPASRLRYEAYSRLQAAAVAFGEQLPIPELVAIGGQSDGKSSLLEAFTGFRFNLKEVEMGTRRPLIVQMVHDPGALEPRCRLQDEDGDDFGPVLQQETAIMDAIRERTESHLRKIGATVSSKAIVMRAEYAFCPNLTIVDTPGFILKARKGDADSTPDDILAMVKAQCAPPHRLILFLQQSSVEWCSSLWMHVIQEVDPHFSRTVMVASKFDNRLKEFSERWEVDKYLSASGYLPPSVKPFFVALPKDRNLQTSAEWRKAIQARCPNACACMFEVDASVLRHLREGIAGGFDEERFGSRIGFGCLRKFLEEELARRYRDAAPATLALLQERCEAVAKELIAADAKLREAGDVAALRRAAIKFVEAILAGSPGVDPAAYGMTTEEERTAVHGGGWPGVTAPVRPPNASLRLFGGAAFERCLQEFAAAAQALEFPALPRDKIANILLAYKSRSGSGGAAKAAEELARCAARDALGPLLDASCARLGAVVKRAYDIAAEAAAGQRGSGAEALRPYVAFHAALRSAFHAFVADLEASARGVVCVCVCVGGGVAWGERCKQITHHHLATATSEFALGVLAGGGSEEAEAPAPPSFEDVENAAPAGTAGLPEMEEDRPVFADTQQTVPETPSPEVLTVNKPDHLGGRKLHLGTAAAGRNVDEHSPGKGRVSKAPRVGGAMGPPPPVAGGAANSAYLGVCAAAARLFGRIRGAVAGQAVPATLKSAFLEPLSCQLSTALMVELLGKSDEEFGQLFTAAGVLAALEASRDSLARRVEGLVRCKNEFQELARVL
eukprot:scaffold40.g5155.t1